MNREQPKKASGKPELPPVSATYGARSAVGGHLLHGMLSMALATIAILAIVSCQIESQKKIFWENNYKACGENFKKLAALVTRGDVEFLRDMKEKLKDSF